MLLRNRDDLTSPAEKATQREFDRWLKSKDRPDFKTVRFTMAALERAARIYAIQEETSREPHPHFDGADSLALDEIYESARYAHPEVRAKIVAEYRNKGAGDDLPQANTSAAIEANATDDEPDDLDQLIDEHGGAEWRRGKKLSRRVKQQMLALARAESLALLKGEPRGTNFIIDAGEQAHRVATVRKEVSVELRGLSDDQIQAEVLRRLVAIGCKWRWQDLADTAAASFPEYRADLVRDYARRMAH
jgi:hypothetical protein